MGQSDTILKPVQYLKGVGPRRAEGFKRLGILTVRDLLNHFPRDWQDRRVPMDLSVPVADPRAVVRGRVLRAGAFPAGPRMTLFKAVLATPTGEIAALWFKHASRRYDVFATLKREVVPDAELWLVGRCEPSLVGASEIHVDEFYPAHAPRAFLHVERLVPLYDLTEGIKQRLLRELLWDALGETSSSLRETLPQKLLQERRLLAYPQALRSIHFPGSPLELTAARERLAYEELLLLELAWLLKRRQTKDLSKNYSYEIKTSLLTPFRQQLGFEMTRAQKRVIRDDMLFPIQL